VGVDTSPLRVGSHRPQLPGSGRVPAGVDEKVANDGGEGHPVASDRHGGSLEVANHVVRHPRHALVEETAQSLHEIQILRRLPTLRIHPGQRQQVDDEQSQPFRLSGHRAQGCGERGRVVGGTAAEDVDVAAQSGHRCPQLVRSVGDEASHPGLGLPLGGERLLDPVRHVIEGGGQLPHLVGPRHELRASPKIASGEPAGGHRETAEREEGAPGEDEADDQGQEQHGRPADQEQGQIAGEHVVDGDHRLRGLDHRGGATQTERPHGEAGHELTSCGRRDHLVPLAALVDERVEGRDVKRRRVGAGGADQQPRPARTIDRHGHGRPRRLADQARQPGDLLRIGQARVGG
jgi:hypothetical protein